MFQALFGLEDGQDVRRTAIAAVRNGYAVVPVEVGGKRPICTLNSRERAALKGERHDCGIYHYLTDDKLTGRVFGRLGSDVNLGVVAGPSRLIVVDADNYAGCMAFAEAMMDGTGDVGYWTYTPTVRTPGVQRGDEWHHKDGGHWYFNVPDGVTLDWTVVGALSDPAGFDVKWGMSQTLVPSSMRPEGRYVADGEIIDAPDWLLERIQTHIHESMNRRTARRAHVVNDSIAQWAQSVDWADLLIPHGWTDSSNVDKCGCPIFEKPGGGSTYKSATAHSNVCELWDNAEGHGPLHLWTTDPPLELTAYAGRNVQKLQFVAAMEYGGSVSEAISGLGIKTIPADQLDWLNDLSPESPSTEWDSRDSALPALSPESRDPYIRDSGTQTLEGSDSACDSPSDQHKRDEAPSPTPGSEFWLEDESHPEIRERIIDAAKQMRVTQRATEYLAYKLGMNGPTMTDEKVVIGNAGSVITPTVAEREDGVPLLYRGRVNTIFGPSEAGKSWFTLACLMSVVSSGGRVLVIDMEDDIHGFISRLTTLGCTQEQADHVSYLRPWSMVTESESAKIRGAARGTDLVIVDSLDAYCALMGMDSNHAVSIRSAGAWLKSIAVAADTAVLLVDHASEKGDGPAKMQMGSSAKKQFIDGSTFRADRLTIWKPGANVCRTMVMAGKDRHGWAKANAEFESETSEWGRIVELTMQSLPNNEGEYVSELRLRIPRSYEDYSGVSSTDVEDREELILDYLTGKPDEWHTRKAVCTAAGDKNARNPAIEQAIAALVKGHVIEHRVVTLRGGKEGNEYRYVTIPESPGPTPIGSGTRDSESQSHNVVNEAP
jgi:hypothetical protein